jgi:hypothetical protein
MGVAKKILKKSLATPKTQKVHADNQKIRAFMKNSAENKKDVRC